MAGPGQIYVPGAGVSAATQQFAPQSTNTPTFAQLVGGGQAGNIAWTSDQGLCAWTGSVWLPVSGGTVANVTAGTATAAAATANTAAIQSALNSGGQVIIATPGVISLNGPLTYYSNTRLFLAINTTLQQLAGTNQMMLQSAAALNYLAGGTAVTLTWSGTGLQVTVNWPSHGLIAGQCVWLSGSTPTAFNGVFRINSVTDANDFVITLRYVPASSNTGSAIGVVATQNVIIEGGTWDYNFANTGSATGRNRSCLWFEGSADIVVRNVRSQNAFKYAFGQAATLNFTGQNLVVPATNSDGFKIYGPVFDCQINGIKGQTSDDGITVQGKEASGFSSYQIAAGGDAINVRIRDVDLQPANTTVMVAGVYLSDNEWTDQIIIDGVGGYSPGTGGAIKLLAGSGYTVGQFGTITIRNLNGANANANILTGLCKGDVLNMEDCRINLSLLNVGNFVFSQSTTIISHMRMQNCDMYQSTWPVGVTAFPMLLQGTHDLVEIEGGYHKVGGTGNSRLIELSGGATTMISISNISDNSDSLVVVASASNNPTIVLAGCNVLGNGAVNVYASCNVILGKGMRYVNASLGVVRCNSTCTVVLKSDGTTTLNAGAWFAVPGGTLTLTCYGFDISVDAGLLATTKGQFFTHSSAVTGRNAANQQGPCIGVDGTHFYALGTGTSGVNTIIV